MSLRSGAVVFETLRGVFAPGDSFDKEAIRAWLSVVDGVPDEALAAAMQVVLRTYRGRGMPPPAVVLEASLEASGHAPESDWQVLGRWCRGDREGLGDDLSAAMSRHGWRALMDASGGDPFLWIQQFRSGSPQDRSFQRRDFFARWKALVGVPGFLPWEAEGPKTLGAGGAAPPAIGYPRPHGVVHPEGPPRA